jgi:REP element-mobilizing transposase RayT
LPRRRTVDHPGAFHHVIVRGAGRHDIFRDDEDRAAYCDRLSVVVPEHGAACLAWALMPNHVHLVVRTGARPLAQIMQRVGTRYSRYFNERHDRVGHLLQGRYHAIPVIDDAQLATLIRYVHANPLRAGIVGSLAELARHRWTGHAALIGRAPAMPFHDTRAALDLFSERLVFARASVRELMGSTSGAELAEKPWDTDVAPAAKREDPCTPADPARALAELIARVCTSQCVCEADLCSGSRRRPVSRARAVVAVVAVHELGVSLAETARTLGVSRQALWQTLERERRR